MKNPINNLEHLTKCPVCNNKYGQVKALVLDEEDNRTTFHVTCDSCKTSALVFISISQFGAVSLGILIDLNRHEVKRFFKKEAVSADQVIEAHEFLKNFKGKIQEFIKI